MHVRYIRRQHGLLLHVMMRQKYVLLHPVQLCRT